MTAALLAYALQGQAAAATTAQQDRVLQSGSWHRFVSLLESVYIQTPDLPVVERACRTAVAAADVLDDASLVDVCLDAAVRALPESGQYVTEARAAAQRMSTGAAPFGSIGVEIARDGTTGPLRVVTPLPDSPAERGGIQPGDQIFEIDGGDITGLPTDKAILGLRGTPGSLVSLRLSRGQEARMMTVDVRRDIIRVSYAQSRLIDGDSIWVRVSHFGNTASRDLARQLAQQQTALQGRMPQALIVDLRNCVGGSLMEVQQALSAFFPANTVIGWSQGRSETTELLTEPFPYPFRGTTQPAWRHVRLIVLVDGKTASGAELFAQALRQHRNAVLLGTRTAGAATIELHARLPNGAVIAVPQSVLLAADRVSWAGKGLTPDIEFSSTGHFEPGTSNDAVLARALQLVSGSGPTH